MPKIKYRKGSKKLISKPLVANPTTDFLRLFYGGTVFGVPVTTSTLTSWSDSSSTLPPEPELRTDLFIYKGGQEYAIRAESSSTSWNDHSNVAHVDGYPHSDSHGDVAHSDSHSDIAHTDWLNSWSDYAITSKHANYNIGTHYNYTDWGWIGEQGSGNVHEDATVASIHADYTLSPPHWTNTWTDGGTVNESGYYHFNITPWQNSSAVIHWDFLDTDYYYTHNDVSHQDTHSDTHTDTHSNWSDHNNTPHSDWPNHSNSWQRLEESI